MPSVSRDPSPEIHFLSSTSGHSFMSGRDQYPAVIHLRTASISCHPSPAAIHLWPPSIPSRKPSLAGIHFQVRSLLGCDPVGSSHSFPPVHPCACMVCIRDFSCNTVRSLKVIFTDLHNVRLPLTVHCSPIIHHKKIPTHWFVHMAWDLNVQIHDLAA